MLITDKDITVGIASYRRPDRLNVCLSALKGLEHVIVWDNSELPEEVDKIKTVESLYPDIKFLYSKENVGCTGAWNNIIVESTTDWVLMTCDDMIFDNDWLGTLNQILNDRPHLEQIHLHSWNAVVFHKKTIVRMGWWDERYRYYPSAEDNDWYMRTVEVLGYSPYVGLEEPIRRQLHPSVIKPVEELLEQKDRYFNDPSNFTFYCNSGHSKYPVLGFETATGGELDAGSANYVHRDMHPENGVKHHMRKWEPVTTSQQITENTIINKDGTMWNRKLPDLDWYPEVRREYAKTYFGIEL